MYQHILIPVDGSSTSEHALQEALRLAQQHGAQLELVYVVENILNKEGFVIYPELQETIRNKGRKILTQALNVVQEAGMTAETKLLEGGGARIASVILAEAKRWRAELIVIGTHGRTGISKLIFGSVAEGVVRTSHIPVLLIRGT
ncbi:MAG: universal stress protein [Nitrosomonas sp.]|jgi:nucleotide-binding universal stress UspA family protein|nr:MAG: universal stress protein [Nitrosomonas sp.]